MFKFVGVPVEVLGTGKLVTLDLMNDEKLAELISAATRKTGKLFIGNFYRGRLF